jgi:acetyl-CoA carboxylase/biotin carboxylase 1
VPQNNGKQTYAELHQIADHFIGGNRVENAKDSKVKDFVIANSGHTVITNVSISPTPAEDWASRNSGYRDGRETFGPNKRS